MDDERQLGEIEATRGDIGSNQNLGAAIAHLFERVGALCLAQLARQRDGGEPTFGEASVHFAHAFARGAEHQCGTAVEIAQQVHHRRLGPIRHHADGAVFDIDVLLVAHRRLDPHRVALEAAGECLDLARHGGGEHQCLPLGRRCVEDEFEVLAEA